MKYRRKRCPKCKQMGARRIIYGKVAPDEKMFAKLDAGVIELGGCIVWDEKPDWHCPHCDHYWNKSGPASPEPTW